MAATIVAKLPRDCATTAGQRRRRCPIRRHWDHCDRLRRAATALSCCRLTAPRWPCRTVPDRAHRPQCAPGCAVVSPAKTKTKRRRLFGWPKQQRQPRPRQAGCSTSARCIALGRAATIRGRDDDRMEGSRRYETNGQRKERAARWDSVAFRCSADERGNSGRACQWSVRRVEWRRMGWECSVACECDVQCSVDCCSGVLVFAGPSCRGGDPNRFGARGRSRPRRSNGDKAAAERVPNKRVQRSRCQSTNNDDMAMRRRI